MKRILAGVIGLVAMGMAAPVSAADLGAQPYATTSTYIPALYDWSGLYVGANGGYGTGSSCWDFTTPSGTFIAKDTCHNATGGVAGGQIGYRWQGGPWVLGAEAQGDWANLRGSSVSSLAPAFTNRTSIDAFGSFTATAGYAWNNVLLYVKGGAALIDARYDVRTTAGNVLAATANDDHTRWGGTAGIGLEYGFGPNWSAAIEYDHLFIQNKLTSFATVPASAFPFGTDRIRSDLDVVTVGVHYRWGGPVIAKY